LAILASILVYSGAGIVKYTHFNKAKSEMEIMQATVNTWYSEYNKIEEDKKEAFIEEHGVSTDDESCDKTALNKTVNATGIVGDFRFLSEKYLKDNLGINSGFEFLVNIQSRKVILFNGLVYNGNIYYTVEDFGLHTVDSIEPVGAINFDIDKRLYSQEVILKNVIFKDDQGKNVNISKFKVKYTKKGENKWIDVTNKISKTTYEDKEAYKFSISKYGEYQVKILTTDDKVESDAKSINLGTVVYSEEYINLSGNNYTKLDGQNGLPAVNLFLAENKNKDFMIKFKFTVNENVTNTNDAVLINEKLEGQTINSGFSFKYSTDNHGQYVLTATSDNETNNIEKTFSRSEVEEKEIKIIKEKNILSYKIDDKKLVEVLNMTNTPAFNTYVTIGADSNGTRNFIGNIENIEIVMGE